MKKRLVVLIVSLTAFSFAITAQTINSIFDSWDSAEVVLKRIRYLDTSLPLEQYAFLIETKERGISVGLIYKSSVTVSDSVTISDAMKTLKKPISKNYISSSDIVVTMLPPGIYSLFVISYKNYVCPGMNGRTFEPGKYYTLEVLPSGKKGTGLSANLIEETDSVTIENVKKQLAEDFLLLNQYTEWSRENPGIFEGTYNVINKKGKIVKNAHIVFSKNRWQDWLSHGRFWYDEKTIIMGYEEDQYQRIAVYEYTFNNDTLNFSGYVMNNKGGRFRASYTWVKNNTK